MPSILHALPSGSRMRRWVFNKSRALNASEAYCDPRHAQTQQRPVLYIPGTAILRLIRLLLRMQGIIRCASWLFGLSC